MEKNYQLTIPQKSIWLTERFYKADTISNISGTLLIKDSVDFELLEQAIFLFIEKNIATHLHFKIVDGIPYQYPAKFTPKKLKIYSVKSKEELKKLEEDFVKIKFELSNSPLFKFNLVRLPDNSGGFNVTMHHIISDAWSMSLLIDQIVAFYSELKKGRTVENDNNYSYIDYIQTEDKYLNSQKFKKDEEFWKEYFDKMPTLTSFSSQNMPVSSQEAKRLIFPLEKSSEIYEFCKKNNISVFTFFMAIYSIYLYKISGVSDIILGTPILNRNGIKEKNTFGMFVNTLPIKNTVNSESSFIEFANKVSNNQFSMFRHHKYPYSEILKFVREKYNYSNNLYDTIISYQNARDNMKTSDISYSTNWKFCGEVSNSLDIHIYDMDDSGTLKLFYDYQLERFSEDEVKNINYRIIYMIEQILDNANISIKDIKLLDDFEKNKLISFNPPELKYDENETLITLFEKQVKKTPNKIALKFKDKTLTYNELYKYVCKFANYLRKKGVKPKTPVVLLINRSLEMVISMLATLKVGAYYVAIDPFWPVDRTQFILQNSDSKFLITNEKNVANFEDKIECILVESIYHLEDDSYFETPTTPDDLAYILYTSGSTGTPKGTLITIKNVVGLLNATHSIFKQTENDIWTLFHTYTFDFSTWEIYGALLYGSKLIIVPKETTIDPKAFLQLVIDEKVTILNQTPAYFYKVIEQEKLLGEKVNLSTRYIILGGEAVQAKPLKYFKEKYPDIIIYNGYGPTETTVFAIMTEITAKNIEENDIYIGNPIPNYKVYILNKDNAPVPIGVDGEICISGVGVCNGYFKKPELTKEKFIKTKEFGLIYKSGDVGHFCNNGKIKYIGRNDNQVKIRGFRIELDEIQKQILNCENVKKAVVVPVENSNLTKSLVAFFEATIPNISSIVLEEIKKHLTSYMIPKLYQIDEFPINNNAKVDTKLLIQKMYNTGEEKEKVKPNTDLEKEIVNILKSITGIKDISTTDDFFEDLGLDSLNVMELSTRLSKYKIEIQDINYYSNIQKLAKKIETHNKVNFFEDKIRNDISIINRPFKYNMSSVLLTGVTGFLGSNILYELLINPEVKKIYCLIRKKYNMTVEDRFNKIVNNYFSNYDIKELIDKKVVLLDGNFEEIYLGLTLEEYYNLSKKITTVIHSGANVRHYGKYDVFYKANVQATKNIIRFCIDSKAKLAHISTISVGGYCNVNDKKLLTENKINVNQTFKNHVYMITKYEAECEILKEIENKNIDAKIFRLGNIMPRISDGRFQINMHQNGFLSRLKTLLDIKYTTNEINNLHIDISPVDLCAKFIIKLMEASCENTVFHISNPNFISMKEILDSFNVEFKLTNVENCINLINKLNNPLNAHLVNDLLSPELIETPYSCDITMKDLNSIKLEWPKITKDYLKNLYNLIMQI